MLPAAGRVETALIQAELTVLERQCQQALRLVEECQDDNDPLSQLQPLMLTAKTQIASVQTEFDHVKEAYRGVLAWFGEPSANAETVPSHHWLNFFCELFTKMHQAQATFEIKEMRRKRQEDKRTQRKIAQPTATENDPAPASAPAATGPQDTKGKPS